MYCKNFVNDLTNKITKELNYENLSTKSVEELLEMIKRGKEELKNRKVPKKKVVINSDYGGFGISKKAKKIYKEKTGKKCHNISILLILSVKTKIYKNDLKIKFLFLKKKCKTFQKPHQPLDTVM